MSNLIVKSEKIQCLTISLFVFLLACSDASKPKTEQASINPLLPVTNKVAAIPINPNGKTIAIRINTPSHFKRTENQPKSFGHYLRHLQLKPTGAEVKYFDGSIKSSADIYCAVVDLNIGKKDLHQCADAIMHLKADYHWNKKEYEKIHFNFTNGHKVAYKEWMKGRRMIVDGNKTRWNNGNQPSNTYADFWNYMELIFTYAGTASLEKELKSTKINQCEIGDILIQGGHPGHAVIVVDKAIQTNSGKPIYLLAQSYMPAQEIQLLINQSNKAISPWYTFDQKIIETPEWTFSVDDLKRFRD